MDDGRFYTCSDRAGVVHIACIADECYDTYSSFEYLELDRYRLDETLCGDKNYLTRTEDPATCIVCLGSYVEPEDTGVEP